MDNFSQNHSKGIITQHYVLRLFSIMLMFVDVQYWKSAQQHDLSKQWAQYINELENWFPMFLNLRTTFSDTDNLQTTSSRVTSWNQMIYNS